MVEKGSGLVILEKKSSGWSLYIGKRVRLIVEDFPYPKPKDGILIDFDDTHLWLKLEGKQLPIPYLRSSIKRLEPRTKQEEGSNNGKSEV